MTTTTPAAAGTVDEIRDNGALLGFMARGNIVRFVFFWGHKGVPGKLGKSCFSQWYGAGFDVDGVHYPTAEHYMMAEKARLFDDERCLKKILASRHPGDAKNLGRTIRSFDEQRWRERRFDIVVAGNVAKFSQNDELKDFLLGTRRRVLVEASPVDTIWGIGLKADDIHATNPKRWPGQNLLGYALMAARTELERV